MAVDNGQLTTDLRTVGVKVDMDEALLILPVDDVPLQRWLPSAPTANIKVEWMEETLTPQTATIVTSADTASPWTIVVADSNIFRAGDLLHIQGASETDLYLVDSITNSTTFEVSSYGTTTDSDDPAAADVFEIVGQLLVEGGDPDDARTVERTNLYNYTQIGQEKVEVSRTARKQAMYALTDPYTHEVQKKFRELAIRFERALTLGYRNAPSGNLRSMGGLFYYISTNSRSNTAANVKASMNSLIRDCWEAGGSPKTLWVSPAVKAAISANVDPTLRRTERSDRTGGFVVDFFMSDFGEISIIADRYFPTTKGLLLQQEFDVRRVFDGYAHEMLAKTGDGDKGEIVGEFSLEVKNETAQGILVVTDAA